MLYCIEKSECKGTLNSCEIMGLWYNDSEVFNEISTVDIKNIINNLEGRALMMNFLEYLLENGGSSIRYRIRREILNEDKTSEEMKVLQNEILGKPKIRKILNTQHEDGWIGRELHGGVAQGLDSSISYLLNSGIEKDSSLMRNTAQALLMNKTQVQPYRTTFKGGDALDLGGRGGNRAIRAGVLADLGEENNLIVQHELEIAISYLRDSLLYDSIDDFSVNNNKAIRYYKENARFPGSNHLNLLSATQKWRTIENIELVKKSILHCMKIMKGQNHDIMYKSGSHFVGPFNFKWSFVDFNIEEIYQDSYALVWWLRSLYKLSKIGVINDIPEFRKSYDYLYQLVISQDILNKQTEQSLKRFKDTLSIEENWRNKKSVFCDVIFYGIMILFNAGYDIKEI